MSKCATCLIFAAVCAISPIARGQDVVKAGAGSYAAFPPSGSNAADAAAKIQAMADRLYIVDRGDRPVPTNDWWTDLIARRYAGDLWPFPLKVTANASGINTYFPTHWKDDGRDMVSEYPLGIGGIGFHPADARATDWGDWTLRFRMAESLSKYMDVTIGRGLPYVWVEYHGVDPQLTLPGGAKTTFFDRRGAGVALPVVSDHLGVTIGDRSFGVFAPVGTRFTPEGDKVRVAFASEASFLVICPLPKASDLDVFYDHAYAIPRSSTLSWSYDATAGQVVTTWKLTTQTLRSGASPALIQGWLPHHLRTTQQSFSLTDLKYDTPRGPMRCAIGDVFRITYPFHGVVPWLPMVNLHAPGFDAARMRDYLAVVAKKSNYGGDTYWGGKDLLRMAQYMVIAKQMHDPSYEPLHDHLKAALVDWLTYTPGEKEHFFARYPKWGAMVGFSPSYGSEGFNDHHFHYGYFVTAGAMLGAVDPQFMHDYGPMLRLIAKDYANWDHADTSEPFLRTFDPWAGHSWASGLSSPGGSNQESSSEAMQSWGGLLMLGQTMGDKDMTAAAAMGYAMESQAVLEYWFNAYGGNWPPQWRHPSVGMIWSGGMLYGTYFSGDPAWIHGIQWLPRSPMLDYLTQRLDAAKHDYDVTIAERKAKEGSGEISAMGAALGNVALAHLAELDPQRASAEFERLWQSHDAVAHDENLSGLTYWLIHANLQLGHRDWSAQTISPTSAVYLGGNDGGPHVVTWNVPSAGTTVDVKRGDRTDSLPNVSLP